VLQAQLAVETIEVTSAKSHALVDLASRKRKHDQEQHVHSQMMLSSRPVDEHGLVHMVHVSTALAEQPHPAVLNNIDCLLFSTEVSDTLALSKHWCSCSALEGSCARVWCATDTSTVNVLPMPGPSWCSDSYTGLRQGQTRLWQHSWLPRC
jgi:hypothetical protein